MVPGEVLPVVGGLTSHKHVPVLNDLLFRQHLVLRVGHIQRRNDEPCFNNIQVILSHRHSNCIANLCLLF